MLGLILAPVTAAPLEVPAVDACGEVCCCPVGDCPCVHPAPEAPDAPLPLPASSEAGSTRAILLLRTEPTTDLGDTAFVRLTRHVDLHIPATDPSQPRLCRWTN
jgi:hypothetical protein